MHSALLLAWISAFVVNPTRPFQRAMPLATDINGYAQFCYEVEDYVEVKVYAQGKAVCPPMVQVKKTLDDLQWRVRVPHPMYLWWVRVVYTLDYINCRTEDGKDVEAIGCSWNEPDGSHVVIVHVDRWDQAATIAHEFGHAMLHRVLDDPDGEHKISVFWEYAEDVHGKAQIPIPEPPKPGPPE